MSECSICKEVITNPICIECVENELITWLYEKKPELIKSLKNKTDEINLRYGDTNCILCKNQMNICTFCYTNYIFSWLKNYPELIEEFKIFFNFSFFKSFNFLI